MCPYIPLSEFVILFEHATICLCEFHTEVHFEKLSNPVKSAPELGDPLI